MTVKITAGNLNCTAHGTDWCDHISSLVESGDDSSLLHPDLRIAVPIIPSLGLYVTVFITDEVYGEAALMQMEYTPDTGRPFTVHLGFWNPGEGCYSIRGVVVDYLKSKVHPEEKVGSGPFKTRCPSSTHGIPEMRVLEEMSNDPLWKWHCLWNMVMEKACTACIEAYSGNGDTGLSNPDDFKTRRPWGAPSA